MAKKQKTQNPPSRGSWYAPFEDEIIRGIIGPHIVEILQEGVSSKTDLRKKFATRTGSEVTASRLNQWLHVLNLDIVFQKARMFRLGHPSPVSTLGDVPGQMTLFDDPGDPQKDDFEFSSETQSQPVPAAPARRGGAAGPPDIVPTPSGPRTVLPPFKG